MSVKVIQVGLGGWGMNWAHTILPQVKAVDVVGFVDASPEALKRAEETLGLAEDRCFPSLDAAIAAVEAEAVLAVLPTAGHKSVSEAALKAGKHVLVEKPFTSTLEEAQELIDLAERVDRILMVSQNYRYMSAVRTVADLVRDGTYGRPLSALIDFRQNWKVTGHRYHDIPGPLLLDMAIHHFDLMRMIFGENVQRVACRSWNTPDSPFKDHAAAHALLALESGLMVSYNGSWVSRGTPTTWTGEWAVECEDGQLVWQARGMGGEIADKLALRKPDGSVRDLPMKPLALIDRAGTLNAFAAAVRGQPPRYFTSGEDNIHSLATSFACMRSGAQDGTWVSLSEILP
ncbi:Gfo/Idh/MocA family protein [Inquilinus sp. NPDC058860]|uniref:Gfo/Idh/MocA family protein n=1 Tax=Inquilinus sp. NPDC058860 TaxID=3346652 RepID=UPI00369F1408